MLLSHVGRADADPLAASRSASSASRRGDRSAGRWRSAAQRARCRCSRRSTRAGRCRRSAGRRRPAPPAPSTSMPGVRRGAPSKIAQQQIASGRGRRARRGRRSRPRGRRARRRRSAAPAGRARDRRAARARCGGAARRGASRALGAAHGRDQLVAVEGAGARRRRRPCRRASRRCGRQSSRISPSRCEIRMQLAARRDEAADEGEQLAGAYGVERRGRLVEDDQSSGSSVTVKARATSTIWRRPIERSPTMSPAPMPWPGKISSSLAAISSPARRRQPKPRSAG